MGPQHVLAVAAESWSHLKYVDIYIKKWYVPPCSYLGTGISNLWGTWIAVQI